ncbi:hypothetical protein ACHAXA_000463 [Cyclostephanos tholiformis]|uniref:Transmembrane protein n=1 Tax=Cyclostephanos tholiformis TaxID=382380 RepID=A0ABD3REI8_9STRA
MGRSSFQCLAPARQLCGGGVVFAILAWSSWAVIFGTFVALKNRSSSCDDGCYDPSFCWSSNVTSVTPSTVCVGDGLSCLEICSTSSHEMNAILNSTIDDYGSYCQENRCDEMVREENEKVNKCAITACVDAPGLSSYQSVMMMLGLLLILLAGTICLNFYREATVCPPKCSPSKEAIGRLVLYGSFSGAVGLVILVIAELIGLARDGMPVGDMYDLAILVVFVYVIGINVILVLCACAGRCLLSADINRDVSIADVVVEEQNAQISGVLNP